tara:strand:- start:579 stop:728 length:150 start_codon:yes stop_codon:yes gene_type:complete
MTKKTITFKIDLDEHLLQMFRDEFNEGSAELNKALSQEAKRLFVEHFYS